MKDNCVVGVWSGHEKCNRK